MDKAWNLTVAQTLFSLHIYKQNNTLLLSATYLSQNIYPVIYILKRPSRINSRLKNLVQDVPVDDWTKHDGLKRLTQTEKGTSRSSCIQDIDDADYTIKLYLLNS